MRLSLSLVFTILLMLLTLNWCVRQVVLVYDQWISLSNIAQGSAVFAYYFIKRHDEREA